VTLICSALWFATTEAEAVYRLIQSPSPLDAIPDPDTVRDRLSVLFAEIALLRRLLRLSLAVEAERTRDRPINEEVSRAH
jgi:hypothetical protein